MIKFKDMAKGLDSSTHQDNSLTPKRIDWTKPKLYGVSFTVHRVCFGEDKDDDFDYNWQGCKDNGYIRSGYGFFNNFKPQTIEQQAQALVRFLKPDPGEMHPWMDFEQANSNYPALPSRLTSLNWIERYIKTVQDGLCVTCGLYTSPKHIIANLKEVPGWLRELPLWVASWPTPPVGMSLEYYLDHYDIRPNIQGQWDHFTLWQYSAKGDGIAMGMESHGLDMDVFNGTVEDLYNYCKITLPVPEEPKEETNMWEENVILASFDKVGNEPAPSTINFDALKLAGVDGVILRIGTSDNKLNPDEPSASLIDDPSYRTHVVNARRAKMFILGEYDHNPMLEYLNYELDQTETNHIKRMINDYKPDGIMLTCERNTWYEGTRLVTCTPTNLAKSIQQVQRKLWNDTRIVTGLRTGRWFTGRAIDPGQQNANLLSVWLDNANPNIADETVPVFWAYWKKQKMMATNLRDVVKDIPIPSSSEEDNMLSLGLTRWRGWEVATVYHPAVLDYTGKPALFRLIIWKGQTKSDLQSLYEYFNVPYTGTTPDQPPVQPPVVDPKILERITKLEQEVNTAKSRLTAIELVTNKFTDLVNKIKLLL
jgi:GH25 family lysozyme M1 (1,4-beta-N-acetylmuramidase)